MYPLSDIRTMNNHFIFKAANMLDRVLRAVGSAAHRNAIKFLQKHYHLNSKNPTDIHNYYKYQNKTKLQPHNIHLITSRRILNMWLPGRLSNALMEITWAIHQTRNIEIDNIKKQSSIYWASDTYIQNDDKARGLLFE